MDLVLLVLQCLWFMVPAYVANFMPVFVRKVRFLNYPIDFGKKFHGERIFGENKTIRGFFFGVSFGILVFYVQKVLYQYSFFNNISLINYSEYGLMLGALLSFGALWGDLIKSFFKRRFKYKSGESWPPFDQMDYAIGAVLFALYYVYLDLLTSLLIIIISASLHFLSTILSYKVGLRKNKW